MKIALLLTLAWTVPGATAAPRGLTLDKFSQLSDAYLAARMGMSPTSAPSAQGGELRMGMMTKSLKPSNAYCFPDLLPIWWSWYFCEYGLGGPPPQDNSCPVQTDKVPPKTTFLLYDILDSCDEGTNVRVCNNIPSDHWIVVNVNGYIYPSDFVNTDFLNNIDTPELLQTKSADTFESLELFFAKLDGIDIEVPRVKTESACKLGIIDTAGCSTDGTILNGWSGFSDGLYLRVPPLEPGSHTIEFKATAPFGGCATTKYELTVV